MHFIGFSRLWFDSVIVVGYIEGVEGAHSFSGSSSGFNDVGLCQLDCQNQVLVPNKLLAHFGVSGST